MKKGDRVIHNYLGNGTVIKVGGLHLVGMCLVKWDNNPSVRYNMGENPCAVWIGELKPEILPCDYCLNPYSKRIGDDVYSANVCYESDCQELFKKKYIYEFDTCRTRGEEDDYLWK